MAALLELAGITKRFGAVQALRGVDFEVRAGEVVALCGDNGAGKSTVVKIISGIYPYDTGEVRFDGRPVHIGSPNAATALGITTVYQDLALCDNLDVVANLFLGREKTRTGLLSEEAMEHQSGQLLQKLSVAIPSVRTPIANLSGGQRQSVAVVKATMGNPKLVILDEPTAALGVTQTAQVLELVRTLRAQGLGVILISHNLQDVFAVADRITVLRLGRTAATFDAATSRSNEVVAAITGADQRDVEDVETFDQAKPHAEAAR